VSLADTADHIRAFAGFPASLRRFLRDPLTSDAARAAVASRLAHREQTLLRIVERGIYDHPASPYLRLLQLAGCERADFRALVTSQGVDEALRVLRGSGIYVTFEEFKGRTPIVRGGTTLPVAARDFDNPVARRHLTLSTGGTTGAATAVHQDLDFIAASAPAHLLMLDAWGVADAPAVLWLQVLPGAGLRFLLLRAKFTRARERWCSDAGWLDSRAWPKYGLATLYSLAWMRAMGIDVGVPEIVRRGEAGRIVRHLREAVGEHGRCLLYCTVSCGLRVAQAAGEAGADLAGVTARVGGEPVTPAKAAAMRRAGLRVMPAYGAIETGSIGVGCPHGTESDHVHVASDAVALVTHPVMTKNGSGPVEAFNLTSLLDASPKVMLNYQIDDHGVVETRACGCPLYAAGYTTSLHSIRSYSKLLGEGVTLMGADAARVLEDVLPARLGGSPLDYQLQEMEDADGFTRVQLVISPHVAIPDEREAVRVFIEALRASSPRGDAGGSVWEQAGTVQVLREEPASTSRGKVMPFHIRPTKGRP
jgi:hypothetical protein